MRLASQCRRWWFPGGAWVSPANFCYANLLQFAGSITTHYNTRVERIAHESRLWRALTPPAPACRSPISSSPTHRMHAGSSATGSRSSLLAAK